MTLSNTQQVVHQPKVETTSKEAVPVKADAPKAKAFHWNSRSVVPSVKADLKDRFTWANILGGASHI
jgi:hypothetical protein